MEQRLHLAKLKETSERVVAWEAALDETHVFTEDDRLIIISRRPKDEIEKGGRV